MMMSEDPEKAHIDEDAEFERAWTKMQNGIHKLQRLLEPDSGESHFDVFQYMDMYTTVYNVCAYSNSSKPYSDMMYKRYGHTFETYLSEHVLIRLRHISDDVLMAKETLSRWDNHRIMTRWLSRFFNYLDRYYLLKNSLPSLTDVAMHKFEDIVFASLMPRLTALLSRMVLQEREGERVDRSLFKNLVDLYLQMRAPSYKDSLEASLLRDTTAYYSAHAGAWIDEDTCPEYMIKAEDRLYQEEERAEALLHINSKPRLLQEVERELLSARRHALVHKEASGLVALLHDGKNEDLKRMYRLFCRVPEGLYLMADVFRDYVTREGEALVRDLSERYQQQQQQEQKQSSSSRRAAEEDGKPPSPPSSTPPVDQRFVEVVVQIHDRMLSYVCTCFGSYTAHHAALQDAFECFCNKPVAGCSTAELMSSYCDGLLKKGGSAEKLSDDEAEEVLDKVVRLLGYISDKDMFAEFYRKKMARRLLNDRSLSDDRERFVLSRLKQLCGAQFTTKMEGMVTDLQLGREKQAQFENWAERQQVSVPIDSFNVTVLTTGFWPSFKSPAVYLPREMETGVEAFQAFYNTQNPHRRLNWIYSLGTVTLKGWFDKRPLELTMSTAQAAVCMLFNDPAADEAGLGYRDMQQRLGGISDDDLKRLLQSLCSSPKHRLLLVNNEGEETVYVFNRSFESKTVRVKIPLPPSEGEKKKVMEDVGKDRKYALDAAVVRVMKSRKTLHYQQLVVEVSQQVARSFKPDFRLLKKRIEELVAREYLERDVENPQVFRYLA